MVKHVVTQDRDSIYPFNPDNYICALPIFNKGVFYGLNLMMGSKFLGTYDSHEEAMREVTNMINSHDEVYIVHGHSNGGFAGWEDDEYEAVD